MTKDKNSPRENGNEKFGVPSYVPPNRNNNPAPIKPATPPPPPAPTPKKK